MRPFAGFGWQRALPTLTLLAALTGCQGGQLRGGVFEPPQPAPPVVLSDQRGQVFDLSAQTGKVVLLYFGYTYCPDVCPTSLADMATARRELGADAARVQVAFVTVDPQRDTPQVLTRYLGAFDKTYLGLTGTTVELKRVMDAYQVKAVRQGPADSASYTMDHTAFIYVIDRAGTLRELMPFGTKADDIANDVRLLLGEK
ncbi:MAG: SCO family protein [Thermoflexales bacterium]